MEIYTGSTNASRIPGHYAYPVHRYNNQPIEPIGRLQGNTPDHVRKVQNHLDRINADEMRETHNRTSQLRDGMSNYSNASFKQQEVAERGLFLNILG